MKKLLLLSEERLNFFSGNIHVSSAAVMCLVLKITDKYN